MALWAGMALASGLILNPGAGSRFREMTTCMVSLRRQLLKVLRAVVILDFVDMVYDLAWHHRIIGIGGVPNDMAPLRIPDHNIAFGGSPPALEVGAKLTFPPNTAPDFSGHPARSTVRASMATESWGWPRLRPTSSKLTAADFTVLRGFHGTMVAWISPYYEKGW